MTAQHILLSLISFILFLFGYHFISGKRIIPLLYFIFVIYCFSYLIYSLCYIVVYYFTGNGIDFSVLYHLNFGLSGAGYSEYKFLISVIIFLMIFGITVGYFYSSKRKSSGSNTSKNIFTVAIFSIIFSAFIHPATVDLFKLSKTKKGDSIWKYYKNPKIFNAPSKPKNLIWIYAESLERSYFNQEAFPGVIKSLREIDSNNLSFTNIGGFPETGWTIAGMVASQCGLPMMSLSHGNSMAGMDSFLPNATCFGDLLSQQGYHLEYLGGSSLKFAGKGSFYQTHGFENVSGFEELQAVNPNPSYKNGWGLYDDTLLDLAYKKYEELSESDEPFGMVLLTLDTHGSGNHYSKSCQGDLASDGNKNIFEAISCSDKLISEFIQRIQSSLYYKETIIVLASDHLTMFPTPRLKKDKRSNLFIIINPPIKTEVKPDVKGSTLDIGVTVLNAMGFDAQMGLGRNLLTDEQSIKSKLELSDSILGNWREEMEIFWSFPQIKERIAIDTKTRTIDIDGRKLKTPILIQYDRELKTRIWFQLYNASLHKTLAEHLSEFKPDEPFIQVDSCEKIKQQWQELEIKKGRLCYVIGTLGSAEMLAGRVGQGKEITKKQLEAISSFPTNEALYRKRVRNITAM